MSEMVEHVAKAIRALTAEDHGCHADNCCCWGAEAFECKSGIKIMDIAGIAIHAMREPTEDMREASRCYLGAGFNVDPQYQAMIDAALTSVRTGPGKP